MPLAVVPLKYVQQDLIYDRIGAGRGTGQGRAAPCPFSSAALRAGQGRAAARAAPPRAGQGRACIAKIQQFCRICRRTLTFVGAAVFHSFLYQFLFCSSKYRIQFNCYTSSERFQSNCRIDCARSARCLITYCCCKPLEARL